MVLSVFFGPKKYLKNRFSHLYGVLFFFFTLLKMKNDLKKVGGKVIHRNGANEVKKVGVGVEQDLYSKRSLRPSPFAAEMLGGKDRTFKNYWGAWGESWQGIGWNSF